MGLITSVSEANALLGRTEDPKKKTGSAGSFKSVLGGKLSGVSEDMDAIFEDAASCFGLSSKLLKAVAKAESNFNPKAVSKAGAMGVMQLMPATARSLGVSDPYDARQNIMGGAKYLKENLDRFGDVRLALAAYNAGPNSVKKYGGVPPYSETQNYVKKIMGYLGGDTLYANRSVTTGGRNSSSLSAAAQLYAMNSMSGASRIGGLGSGNGSSAGGSSSPGLGGMSGLYGLGGSGSISGMGGLNGLSGTSAYGLSGLYGAGLASSMYSGLALSEDEDTVTLDKETYASLIQMLRIQSMMNAGRDVGALTL